MENNKQVVHISATVKAPVEKVWKYWNGSEHIVQWNSAGGGWHCPRATNDLRVGGKISSRMESADGSEGFDFEGTYDLVKEKEEIAYTLGDGRKVHIRFREDNGITHITESFEAENTFPVEMQQQGWQAILDNFKAYTEKN